MIKSYANVCPPTIKRIELPVLTRASFYLYILVNNYAIVEEIIVYEFKTYDMNLM